MKKRIKVVAGESSFGGYLEGTEEEINNCWLEDEEGNKEK